MKYQSMCRICPVCGKHRGGNTDHAKCSRIMQKKRQRQERHKKPAEVNRLFKDFQYHEMRGNEYDESA